MIHSHQIIDHIVGFTALRDLELLEFSLLNTVSTMIKPSMAKIIKLDNTNTPIKQTEYNHGDCEIRYDHIELPEVLLSFIEFINSSDVEELTRKTVDSGFMTVRLLIQTRHTSTFLIISHRHKPVKQTEYMLDGMFEVYHNFSQLLIDSQTDVLTGLANRTTFDDTISKIAELPVTETDDYPDDQRDHCVDDSASYWLALIDIDHFKHVNDSYGHLYGDEVLVIFSSLLKSSFREQDRIFRFGGEEFVVILKSPDKKLTGKVLERLRHKVETAEFPGVGHITATIGAVRMSLDIFHITLLDYADQALYYGKSHGRNQLNFFEDLLEQGEVRIQSRAAGDIEIF